MTVSFEIASEHRETAPPFVDGCETCLMTGFHGVVVPHATITQGDSLMAFYHHGRCGKQWHTGWSAQWDHTWQRVEGGPRPVKLRGQLRALPAPDADRSQPRRLEPDELDRCPRCRFESCRCPSLEDAPYGTLAGEPGYIP